MSSALALLGVVVLHATWLAVAAAAVAAIALRRLGADRPRARYGVALAALLVVPPAALACALAPHLATGSSATTSAPADLGAAAFSLAPATPWIGLVWALGAAWGLLGLAVAHERLARLRRGARPVPGVEAERLLARARGRLQYMGPLELAISPEVGVPTVLGWRRPLCALPAEALTAWPAELEWLLVHELAHVRRADIAWSWAQSLVEVGLFFHPAARWLARVVRHERECCCDAAVLAGPDARVPYVRALTRLAAADRSSLRSALSITGGTLVSRIERIVDPTAPIRSCSRGLCLVLVLGALAGAATLAACETEEKVSTARVLDAAGPLREAREVVAQAPASAPPEVPVCDDKGAGAATPPDATANPGKPVERVEELPIPFIEGPYPDQPPMDTDGC